MNNFKGTKGKWFACCLPNNPHYIFCNEGEKTICKPIQAQEMGDNLSEDEFKANALLISKAPEMLEMLEELIKANPAHEGYHGLKLKAINLIKEATEL